MKNSQFTVIRCFVALMAVGIILSSLPSPAQGSDAVSITNELDGELTVFEQDYSVIYAIPDNVCMAYEIYPNGLINHTFDYDYERNAVRVNWTNGNIGKLLVGDLSAAVISNITLDLGFARSDFNTEFQICAANADIYVQIRNTVGSDSIRLRSYYYYPSSIYAEKTTLVEGLNDDGRFNITIESNGLTLTNNIYLDGVWQFETPYWKNNDVYGVGAFDQIINPYIYFVLGNPTAGNWGCLRLYEITQTIPSYSYITPISDSSLVPFGFDGPHSFDTIQNGVELLESHNETATIWADVDFIASYSPENITILKQLIENGWELGIHYSVGLTTKTMEQAIAIMDQEYEEITAIFGRSPTTWCSLSNQDNKSHADYAYANLNMVWRNGYNGISALSNVGNLCDRYWPWWENASAAGIAYPSFTHETDLDPAVLYSISISNFTTWLDNYIADGKIVCGYYDYWTIAQNTYHSNLTDLILISDRAMSFSLDNIGGISRLSIYAPWAELILDAEGNEINFETAGDYIILEVGSGDYQIMTDEYYHQLKINIAYSSLTDLLPIVITLMVIVGVVEMVLGIKKRF